MYITTELKLIISNMFHYNNRMTSSLAPRLDTIYVYNSYEICNGLKKS